VQRARLDRSKLAGPPSNPDPRARAPRPWPSVFPAVRLMRRSPATSRQVPGVARKQRALARSSHRRRGRPRSVATPRVHAPIATHRETACVAQSPSRCRWRRRHWHVTHTMGHLVETLVGPAPIARHGCVEPTVTRPARAGHPRVRPPHRRGVATGRPIATRLSNMSHHATLMEPARRGLAPRVATDGAPLRMMLQTSRATAWLLGRLRNEAAERRTLPRSRAFGPDKDTSSHATTWRSVCRPPDVPGRRFLRVLTIRFLARLYPARATRIAAAFLEVSYPSTLAEVGSDLHRDYLSRLCYAFRLSQPLDVLFRPQPSRPCFMPETPLGFRFQRVPLLGSGSRLSTPPSLHAVLDDRPHVGQDDESTGPDFKGSRTRRVRSRQAGVTR